MAGRAGARRSTAPSSTSTAGATRQSRSRSRRRAVRAGSGTSPRATRRRCRSRPPRAPRRSFRSRSVAKRSAGILLHRRGPAGVEALLVHPGGPFWAKKDLGAWSIPKGEHDEGEDGLACALREFREETGTELPGDGLTDLGTVKQRAGKVVQAWAAEGDLDSAAIRSNLFTMEWPPRSGTMREFPEVDRAAWFGLEEARRRINPAQAEFLERIS